MACLFALAACGDDGDSGTAAPAGSIVQEMLALPSSAPPPNPGSGTVTPGELNRARAVTYRLSTVGDRAVDKVLILMPGFVGGAGTFDHLARQIVGRTNGTTVVWAVDRRSNALEDQTGLDAAEVARDPEVAKGYYFRGTSVDGRSFAGLLTDNGSDISYLSEWGIAVHVADLDTLITEARQRYPNAAVFLGGHSLGAAIAPIYAAWNFGDHAGFERLSGLVLLEGAPSPAPPESVPSREEYEIFGLPSGLGTTSLDDIRTGTFTASIPFVEPELFIAAEIVAMRASPRFGAPTDLSPDTDIFGAFVRLLFGLTQVPPVTNEAALGLGFDNDFQPLAFIQASIGEVNGPVGPNTSLAAQILQADTLAPTDPSATYTWRDRFEQMRPEPTTLATFAELLYAGPSNFIEWYFPARLSLDAQVTSSLNVQPSGDWRLETYGMAVTENARVDVPVFAVGGSKGLVSNLDRFHSYRDSIAPVLRGGTRRDTSPFGFQATIADGHAHLDPLTAEETGGGNGVFAPLVAWMDAAVELAPPH